MAAILTIFYFLHNISSLLHYIHLAALQIIIDQHSYTIYKILPKFTTRLINSYSYSNQGTERIAAADIILQQDRNTTYT